MLSIYLSQSNPSQILVPISYEFTYMSNGNGCNGNALQPNGANMIKKGSSHDKKCNNSTSSPITTTTSVDATSAQRNNGEQLHNDELEEEEVEIIIDLNATKTKDEDETEEDIPKVEEEILRNIIMHLIPTTKKTFVDDILDGVSSGKRRAYFCFQ